MTKGELVEQLETVPDEEEIFIILDDKKYEIHDTGIFRGDQAIYAKDAE